VQAEDVRGLQVRWWCVGVSVPTPRCRAPPPPPPAVLSPGIDHSSIPPNPQRLTEHLLSQEVPALISRGVLAHLAQAVVDGFGQRNAEALREVRLSVSHLLANAAVCGGWD